MELFGVPIETLYLYGLFISGAITVLYLFFGDILNGIETIFSPVLIFSFMTIFSAGGYIAEMVTVYPSVPIAVGAALLALILVTMLNVFVLAPIAGAEESLVYKESDLCGKTGIVITSIPADGLGEVLIESVSGRIAKPAASFTGKEIPYGQKVLVINVENGVLQVSLYEEMQHYIEGGTKL
ncbi:NfeD family protein [Bacillus massilinigeriensis]|uniref:NfeD family protein n=1 Tax=Bacillus mediterraneensis TaxID=1805474 RepID=UPI0008F860D9|nr:NfeD family protein [Bacillus mediterraneensis]